MKSLVPYPVNDEVLSQLVQRANSASNPDEVVHSLRAAGFDKIDCIKFVREQYEVSLGRAKDIVHLSAAWADRYQSDEAFHDAAEQALKLVPEEKQSAA